ncbi:transporter substrate-binding domain-containing protein [Psychrobacillus sp. BL-248-WT-3]|uniref:transporter substrate-binding domain-containing protein n=1 Tax=Psychrobacillus sp. BL-248-WT-3 TaxID=2725306 RepID=UPI00146C326F|nr:transporter substrate-binding domain-containing protein [Psychrobacillus sp. BL-248-WT-3]NME06054.1 transporter substrate-binding domain-containing protein [Psychrobacillus sp. BL-248-WT-3]
MKKRLFTFTFLLSIFLLLAACGTKEEGSVGSASAQDTFTVGLEAGYAPFNWTQMDDKNGGVKLDGNAEYAGGYDVEIAKKIAEGLGKELVIVKTEWDGLVPALTSGKIDAIIAGMSPTAERKKTIDFSENYYTSNFVMVVKKGGKFEDATSIQDFNGAKVTGQLNTSHYGVIDQIKGVKKQPASDNFPAMRVALESGMIDGYVSERPEGISASSANDNFSMVEFEEGFIADEEETAVAVGLKKGSDLTDKINEILAGISEEERQEIMDNAISNQPAAE